MVRQDLSQMDRDDRETAPTHRLPSRRPAAEPPPAAEELDSELHGASAG
jgi:hypothetical protein